MRRYTDSDVTVTLSPEGLRRAYRDNALLAKSARRRETIHAWLFAIALGMLMGWSAAQGLAS
jgi:hypothetical protein